MRNLGIFLIGSLALAACASNNTPPAASSDTVAQATNDPNRGPNFAPASSDGVAAAPADTRRANNPTQPAPSLGPPSDSTASRADVNAGKANGASGDGADGSSGVDPSAGNVAAAPADRTLRPATEADNSRINQRDRGGKTLTPMDQGSSESDRKITQQIRQAVMQDKSLSFTAKNVKIITINGKVTLRGPVKSEAERSAIESAARKITGDGGLVDSQIELSK